MKKKPPPNKWVLIPWTTGCIVSLLIVAVPFLFTLYRNRIFKVILNKNGEVIIWEVWVKKLKTAGRRSCYSNYYSN